MRGARGLELELELQLVRTGGRSDVEAEVDAEANAPAAAAPGASGRGLFLLPLLLLPSSSPLLLASVMGLVLLMLRCYYVVLRRISLDGAKIRRVRFST